MVAVKLGAAKLVVRCSKDLGLSTGLLEWTLTFFSSFFPQELTICIEELI